MSHSQAPQGVRILTASDDNTAKIWEVLPDSKEPTCIATLHDSAHKGYKDSWQGHRAGVSCLACGYAAYDSADHIPTGKTQYMVVTGSRDTTMKVWNPDTYACEMTLPNIPVTLTTEEKMMRRLAKQDIPPPMKRETGHTEYVNGAIWCQGGPNMGKEILSWSDDKTVIRWDLKFLEGEPPTAKMAQVYNGYHSLPISKAVYFQEGSRIVTASYDKTCIMWETSSGKAMRQFPGTNVDKAERHSKPLWDVACSPNGTELMTSSQDGTARTWDLTTGQNKMILSHKIPDDLSDGTSEAVLGAVYTHHGDQALTYSMDNTARIWDLRADPGSGAMRIIHGHSGCVWKAEIPQHDMTKVLTCSHDMTALVWDLKRMSEDPSHSVPCNTLDGHTGILWEATFSQDGNWILTCSEDRTARIWNMTAGSQRPPCHILGGKSAHSYAVTHGCFMDMPQKRKGGTRDGEARRAAASGKEG